MGSKPGDRTKLHTKVHQAVGMALTLAGGCLFLASIKLPAQATQPKLASPAAQPAPIEPADQAIPIAIVPVSGAKVTGAMEIPDGKAAIESNGSITAGEHNVQVTLPHRGFLKVCPTTKINLLTDSSVATGVAASGAAAAAPKESPGLMMALDRGAFEGYFATRANSDVILTPNYRIVVSGPGSAAVQVRLGDHGDLCVGNSGENAPYVTVSSIFEGGVYRVNANQRVTFQHGSLNQVIDREKESCGCPPEAPPAEQARTNEFPIAQSEGLAPLPSPPPNALQKGTQSAQATIQLGYSGDKPPAEQVTAQAQTAPTIQLPKAAKADPKPGFLHRVGHFFKKIFGG